MAKKKKKKKVVVMRNVVVAKKVTKKKSAKKNKPVTAHQKIASFGGVMFQIYSTGKTRKALLPQNMKQVVSSEWSEHKRIGYRAKPEFNGAGRRSYTMTIVIDIQLGYKPHAVLKQLHQYCEKGMVYPLIIGTHKIGKYKWYIRELSDEFNLIYSGGELARAMVDVSMEEYC